MWFKKKGLIPTTKREVPDGLWLKCESCGELLYRKELVKSLWVCEGCGYHFRISAQKYIELLVDEFVESNNSIKPTNILGFPEYDDKLKSSAENSGVNEAIITGEANIGQYKVAMGVMEFEFMAGSMGSVLGEKVKVLIDLAIEKRLPVVIVSASGGARMQEGIISLMQMAKTASALTYLAAAKLPYISILTNPTTAGVMASYASLGDIIIAEPRALIGFAGPRVIQQTINQELPEGFQRSEFLLEHGLIDAVVPRAELKSTLIRMLDFFAS